jgi:hypothetical protein
VDEEDRKKNVKSPPFSRASSSFWFTRIVELWRDYFLSFFKRTNATLSFTSNLVQVMNHIREG